MLTKIRPRLPCRGLATAAAGKDSVIQAHTENVVPTYARFDLALSHGEGSYVWDYDGKKYLDMAGGIAVNCLGHSHPAIVAAVEKQAKKLMHISNLYYNEEQGQLAERIVNKMGPGKVFFCNSGAEANEGLFKLARLKGNEAGRYGIITALDSFHGRTLAGISATGETSRLVEFCARNSYLSTRARQDQSRLWAMHARLLARSVQ
jgi:acetylornithine/succinyldiaminopimelate/putrescine aminotransferase